MTLSDTDSLGHSAQSLGNLAIFASLAKAAGPDLYRSNAFRVTGLPVNSNQRDITRYIQQQEMRQKFGGDDKSPAGPLPLNPAPSNDEVREAIQRLRDPEERLVDEFFWFWPEEINPVNDVLSSLKRYNSDNIETRLKQEEAELDDDGGIEAHNLAILAHATALDLEHSSLTKALSDDEVRRRNLCWREAYRRWASLVERESLWYQFTARIREISDPRLTTGFSRRMRAHLPSALLSINAHLAASGRREDVKGVERHVLIMRRSGFGAESIDDALKQCSRPARERLKELCKAAERDAASVPGSADRVAHDLLKEAEQKISVLDVLLPEGDLLRDDAHDLVAQAGNACARAFARETKNWKVVRFLLELILPVAASHSLRTQLETDLATVRGNDLWPVALRRAHSFYQRR